MRTVVEGAVDRAPASGWIPLVLAALIGLGVGDALRPPPRQTGARAAILVIDAYRASVSKWLGATGIVRCRYTPTCSAYGREAISSYGFAKGSWLTAGRILRCNPWSRGGVDPVP